MANEYKADAPDSLLSEFIKLAVGDTSARIVLSATVAAFVLLVGSSQLAAMYYTPAPVKHRLVLD